MSNARRTIVAVCLKSYTREACGARAPHLACPKCRYVSVYTQFIYRFVP